MSSPTLCLIGAGRAGGSLARQWQAKGGFEVVAIHSRKGAPALARDLAALEIKKLGELPETDAILIATSDSAIAPIAGELATSTQTNWHKKLVFHLSGSLPANVLQPLADRGARIASAHPVRAFSHDKSDIEGTWVGLEGESPALAILQAAFHRVGAQCFGIDGEQKGKYHAAAVIASNHLVALAHASQQLWQQAGVDQQTAQSLFESLTTGVLNNLKTAKPAQALTGPIARRDASTIATHIQQLETENSDIANLYRHLSRYLIDSLDLAHDDSTTQQLLSALSDKTHKT